MRSYRLPKTYIERMGQHHANMGNESLVRHCNFPISNNQYIHMGESFRTSQRRLQNVTLFHRPVASCYQTPSARFCR